MSYSLTYAGVIVTLLGWLGLAHIATSGEVASIIDNIVQIVGLAVTIYGRYRSDGTPVNIIGVKQPE